MKPILNKFLTISLITLFSKPIHLLAHFTPIQETVRIGPELTSYLYTGAIYAITNKGTGQIVCSPDNEIHFQNANHWWTIQPSHPYWNSGKYNITNYGQDPNCEIGKDLILIRVQEEVEEDIFLISSAEANGVSKCSGNETMYHGELNHENGIIAFYGTLNFTCFTARNSHYNADLKKILTEYTTATTLPQTPYHFHFHEYTALLHTKYEVLGHLENFKLQKISEAITNKTLIDDAWKIGFLDTIENCSNFPQQRKVTISFQNNETTQALFSQEHAAQVNKLSSFSISAGGSVSVPLPYISPSIGVHTGKVWSNRSFNVIRDKSSEFSSVTRTIDYKYVSTVTVAPWKVAKVKDYLGVVKDLEMEWKADLVVKLKPRESMVSGNEGCFGVEEVVQIFEMLGYNVPQETWNATVGGFIVPITGPAFASYATESYVEVTETECPQDKQMD